MTTDALRGSDHERDPSLPVVIGVPDSNIFLCPTCARPLAVGVSRCPACRTHLVAGVQLRKVTGFVGIGLAAGIVLFGGAIGLLAVLARPLDVTVVPSAPPVVEVAPSAVPLPSAAPAPVEPAVPPAALAALQQSTLINQRLLTDADRLARVVARKNASAADIAPILRGLASTASFGNRLPPAIATWADGAAVSQGLGAFYAAIGRVAGDGLAASISNDRAYVLAGRQMLNVLAALTDLDAASRGLAAGAGAELPPLGPAG